MALTYMAPPAATTPDYEKILVTLSGWDDAHAIQGRLSDNKGGYCAMGWLGTRGHVFLPRAVCQAIVMSNDMGPLAGTVARVRRVVQLMRDGKSPEEATATVLRDTLALPVHVTIGVLPSGKSLLATPAFAGWSISSAEPSVPVMAGV